MVVSGGSAGLALRVRRTLLLRRPCSYTIPAARPRGRRRGAWKRRRTTAEADDGLAGLVRGRRRGLPTWRLRSCTLPASRPHGRGCGAWRRRLSTAESSGGLADARSWTGSAAIGIRTSVTPSAIGGPERGGGYHLRRGSPRGALTERACTETNCSSASVLEPMAMPAALELLLGGAARSSRALARELWDFFITIGDVAGLLVPPASTVRIA